MSSDTTRRRNKPTRFVVLGTSGSGKTTFARQLAFKLAVPHVELDSLHWDSNWMEAPDDIFRQRIANALSTESGWVVDGNYHRFGDLTWARAHVLVWLDYPLWLTMARIIWRTVSRP
jgi:adenylate kinase family enzyme